MTPLPIHRLSTGDPIRDSLAELSAAVNIVHEHLALQDIQQASFHQTVETRLDALDQRVAACLPRPVLAVLLAQGKQVLTFVFLVAGGTYSSLTLWQKLHELHLLR